MWASVFGTLNEDALAPSGSNISTAENPSSAYYSNNEVTPGLGAEEFLEAFGGDAIKIPFQDGHYIYTVVAGTGSGSQSVAPIIFVADLESPFKFLEKVTTIIE